jgi:hypothetical protein
LLLATAVGFWFCSPSDHSGKVESITIGGLISDAAALIITAEDKHFFAANGINLIFKA